MKNLLLMRAPLKYIQGEGSLTHFYENVKSFGSRFLFICSNSGYKATHDQLEESFTTVDPVTVNNSFTHRDIQWAIGQDIDHDLMKSNITSTPVRTRVQPSQRDKIHAIDVRDTIPLNTRTQVKGFDILSIPIPYRSVYSRTTDTIQANPKQHTFQLYDSEEDYMMKVMPWVVPIAIQK